MKKMYLILSTFLTISSVCAQKNTLSNLPDYQIFNDNMDKLVPAIPVTRKELKKENGLWEKLEVQSSQNSVDKNDINILVVITKYQSNPLNVNPFAAFMKTERTLDQNLSLKAAAFDEFEGDVSDAIEKGNNNRIFSQINIDPEEKSDFRVKKGGEKMKKREFGTNLDAMFNYTNSLLKGSFHDAEAKWDLGKEFRHFYYAAAGNVVVRVEVEVYGKGLPPEKTPDARAIASAILAKLPKDKEPPTETKFEIYPKMTVTGDANEYGLIPASPLLPAKIIYKVGRPNVNVTFSLMANGTGELRVDDRKGSNLNVTSDAKGEATVWYHYTDTKEITAPVEVQVIAEVEGKSKKGFINVGLGLAFDQLNAIPEQVYQYAPSKPYAFALSVKSRFFPKINLVQYIAAAHESKIWGDKKIGIQLVTKWVNQPDGAPADEYYVGTAMIEPTRVSNNSNVLVANRRPWAYYTNLSYPAVVLNSEGTHIYQVRGEIAVLAGDQPDQPRIAYMSESMLKTDALLPMSSVYPEQWYKSIACALASVQTDQQYFLLEAVKLIPTYGMIADVSTTASSFLCGILNGEYEKSILDLASWVGGQYIDNLMEAGLFNKLTKSSQDAVLAAKTAYFGTDMYKKKGELEQIRAKQKELSHK